MTHYLQWRGWGEFPITAPTGALRTASRVLIADEENITAEERLKGTTFVHTYYL
jgi:hypothetical protein